MPYNGDLQCSSDHCLSRLRTFAPSHIYTFTLFNYADNPPSMVNTCPVMYLA
jgi:hypothetical protein